MVVNNEDVPMKYLKGGAHAQRLPFLRMSRTGADLPYVRRFCTEADAGNNTLLWSRVDDYASMND